jgi:hypothetical protein
MISPVFNTKYNNKNKRNFLWSADHQLRNTARLSERSIVAYIWETQEEGGETRGQFHQRSTHSFYVHKLCVQLFCA